jgi:carboxyl-terminal processing protease
MIRLCGLALCALAVAAAPSGHAQTPAKAGYVQLYDRLWSTVDQNFYDPRFHGVDWAGVGERYRSRLKDVDTDAEFRTLAATMLKELRSSHLEIRAPSALVSGGARPAVQVRELGGLRLVTSVAAASHAQTVGLRPGDALLSPDSAIPGPLGSTAQLKVSDCEGRERTLSVRRERAFWPLPRPSFQWSTVTTGPGRKIGYLRADRFDDGADALADQAMSDLADTSALVIDVRNNSGGNMSAMRLASYFSEGERPSVALLARPYLQALGRPVIKADLDAAHKARRTYTTEAVFGAVAAGKGGTVFYSEDLGAKRYTKPVVVLIGPETGSAAEGFGWYMRMQTQARLVGQPSAGALLSGQTFPLADGWSVVVPVSGIWSPDGQNFGDQAVQPHLPVTWTRADLCRGRDPDMAKALEVLGGGGR